MSADPSLNAALAEPAAPAAKPLGAGGRLRAGVLGVLALHDVLIVAYLIVVLALLGLLAKGPTPIVGPIVVDVVALVGAGFVARAVPEVPRWLRVNVYGVLVVFSIVFSYLILRDVLPVVRQDAVDDSLAAIDVALFGVQPAFVFEKLNRRPIIEWLSFFYFGYYIVAALYAVGVVWVAPGARTKLEFGIGTAIVFCTGHLLYMCVPAFGPYKFFEAAYKGPVDGGFFWGLVWNSVHSAGALKDVFPSLHTAAPTWFSLFAVTQARRDPRWRIPAALTCFFAVNIVVSTMVLRWHYVIDVIAGLTLASTAALLAPRLAAWDASVRARRGVPEAWQLD
jgi:membrane-associated phospholipid phosphatase